MATIEEYLRGCIAIEISDEAISSILLDRGVEEDSEAVDLSQESRDLCKADVYMWAANCPSTKTSNEDVNGVWKHKEGGYTINADNRNRYLALARAIYLKYGLLPIVSKRIQTKSYGFRTARSIR